MRSEIHTGTNYSPYCNAESTRKEYDTKTPKTGKCEPA